MAVNGVVHLSLLVYAGASLGAFMRARTRSRGVRTRRRRGAPDWLLRAVRLAGAMLLMATAACGLLNELSDADTDQTVRRLPEDVERVLAAAPKLELLALDPQSEDAPRGSESPVFHDFTVLGRQTISAPADRARLLEVIRRGVREHPGYPAACFLPRHGVRARSGGRVADLVICYECLLVRVYLDGRRLRDVLTATEVETEVTAIYEAAGLRVAPHD